MTNHFRFWPVLQFADKCREEGWPTNLKASLIGSCTNSSYEDMTRSASIARQALAAGAHAFFGRGYEGVGMTCVRVAECEDDCV
jgi:hypothetical protein